MFTFIRIVKSFKVRTVGSNLILNSISYTQSFIKRRHRYQRMWSRYGIQNISSITNICKYPYRGIYILTIFSIIEKKEFEEKGRIIGKKRKREKNNLKRVSVLKGGKLSEVCPLFMNIYHGMKKSNRNTFIFFNRESFWVFHIKTYKLI